MDENIKYPMFGDDYKKRSQYSADLIHQEALKWIDSQDGNQPFYGFFTYTLPHAELVQPNDSILEHYKKNFSMIRPGVDLRMADTIRQYIHMQNLPV